MRIIRALLLLLFAGWLHGHVQGQEYRAFARRYSIEEGLPHRQVNAVIQDRRGFIWAATKGGVARFDGHRFKVINKADNGLSSDNVDELQEDAAGYIWAFYHPPNAFCDRIDPYSGQVTPYRDLKKMMSIPVDPSTAFSGIGLLPDSSIILAIDSPRGFLKYHPKSGWQKIGTQGPELTRFLYGDAKRLWGFACHDNIRSLCSWDYQGNMLSRTNFPQDHMIWENIGSFIDPGHFYYVERDGQKNLQICEIKADGTRLTPPDFLDAKTWKNQYQRIRQDRIIIQCPYIFDRNGRSLLNLQELYPELDPGQFWDYLVDRSGKVWFATSFGLIVVDVREVHFKRLLYDEKAPGGRGKACRGLLEQGGMLTVNLEAYGQKRFLLDPGTGAAKQLIGESAYGIGRAGDGDIWSDLGDENSGFYYTTLIKTGPDGQIISRMTVPQPNGYIWSILEENPQRVLISGGQWGIKAYNPLTGALVQIADTLFPTFSKDNFSFIAKDRSGNLLACGMHGLYRLEPGANRILEHYWSGGEGKYYLPYDFITYFYEDAEGVYWLCTCGNGLIRWKPPFANAGQDELTNIYRKNGLVNGVVYCAYEDSHNMLWLSTDYGIVQFDKKNLQVLHTWLVRDGITNNEFNRISHCRGSDGTLYFGGLNGITAFNPEDFYNRETQTGSLPLVISDFHVFDEDTRRLDNRTAALLGSNAITIRPSDRYIQLEFALLDYTAPENVTYSWKMDGLSTDWVPLKEPVLRLSGLPYGVRRLHVRAQAGDGTMADQEIDITLRVLPPVYLRWWFLLVMLGVVLLGIWAWIKWRTATLQKNQVFLESEIERQTGTIRKQSEALRALDAAKSRFYANISHELRTPLTLMLGPLDTMLKRNKLESMDAYLAQSVQKNSKDLLYLVNEILDLSKLESGSMKLQETPTSLQPYLRRVLSAFESHAERLGIRLVFEYRAPERLRVLVDHDKLQKVLNNLISNALKFTPPHADGVVSIRVEDRGAGIQIQVHDNGRGIHVDDLPHIFDRFYQSFQKDTPIEGGTGIGLALCREIAELFEGKVWAESTVGKGSAFYFEFPKKEVLGTGAQDSEPDVASMPSVQHAGFEPAAPSGPGRAKVLLVEDNDSLRDYVKLLLSEHYQVQTAENGQAALKVLENELPQMIISDIMMPVMDGFQLLERLKNNARTRTIPVVMLTARADIRDKLQALRIGVDDYLLKPFESEELLARVENLLHNAELRRAESPVTDESPSPADPAGTERENKIGPEDLAWLEQLEKTVLELLGDSRLNADWLAEKMVTSRNLFFKKVKVLSGVTPNEYIQTVRFTRARYLLETRRYPTVKETAYAVGLRDVKYFSEMFRKHFGKLPSDYLQAS